MEKKYCHGIRGAADGSAAAKVADKLCLQSAHSMKILLHIW